jgi:ubiquinone/menaquinone biosynthesis C-methylase UbiE
MSKALVQQQFGAHAASYVTSPVHAKGASLQRMVTIVEPRAHWRMLDIATAAGHTALAFAPHVAKVTATDLTPEMLSEAARLAAERGMSNVEFAPADAEALPFADRSFDLVTCRIAAHHFPDVARFLAEAVRVLEPGGTFALVDNVSPDVATTPGFSEGELRSAVSAYNAFEKLRDPSHGYCLRTSEWLARVSEPSLAIRHLEHLPKEMEFAPWVERMGVDAPTRERLRSMLTGAQGALEAFLRPRQDGDRLWFTLHEVLIVAHKPS